MDAAAGKDQSSLLGTCCYVGAAPTHHRPIMTCNPAHVHGTRTPRIEIRFLGEIQSLAACRCTVCVRLHQRCSAP